MIGANVVAMTSAAMIGSRIGRAKSNAATSSRMKMPMIATCDADAQTSSALATGCGSLMIKACRLSLRARRNSTNPSRGLAARTAGSAHRQDPCACARQRGMRDPSSRAGLIRAECRDWSAAFAQGLQLVHRSTVSLPVGILPAGRRPAAFSATAPIWYQARHDGLRFTRFHFRVGRSVNYSARLPPDVRVSGGPGPPSPHRHLSLVRS